MPYSSGPPLADVAADPAPAPSHDALGGVDPWGPPPAPRTTHGALGGRDPWAAAPAAAAPTHGALALRDPWNARYPAPAATFPAQVARDLGWRAFAEAIEVIAIALLMFIVVRGLAQNFIIDGGSMEPTFLHSDMVIVNKLAYRAFDLSWLPFAGADEWRPFGEPQQGDVIVFRFPLNQDRDFIKRVIATPGQTVELRGGEVLIDGQAIGTIGEPHALQLPQRALSAAPSTSGAGSLPAFDHDRPAAFGPVTVPPEHVFVLGDARRNSYDSRDWGFLSESMIVGRADLLYWPFDRFGLIRHGWGGNAAQ